MSDDQPKRPIGLELKPETIPDVLADQSQWVCWRYELDDGRGEWTKVPVNVDNGRYASSTDDNTWSSFSDALAYHEEDGTNTDGIGFVVHEEDLFVGVDLDDCRDPTSGDIESWATDLVDSVSTYAEVSPSGTGVRLFGLGFVPDGGNRGEINDADGHIEIYDQSRFLTVTGHHINETPKEVCEVNDEIADIHTRYIADNEDEQTSDRDADSDVSNSLTDEEVLEKIRSSKNSSKFKSLWEGNTSGYESHSEADLALCGMLAFWTGGDDTQIDRLFRQSDLMRSKWDENRGSQTYGEHTIEKSLEGRTEFYTLNRSSLSDDAPWHVRFDGWIFPQINADDRPSPDVQVAKAAELLQDDFEFLIPRPEGDTLDKTPMFVYHESSGIYKKGGETLIKEEVNQNEPINIGPTKVGRVIDIVKSCNLVSRDDLNAGAEDQRLVNLQDCVLDLDTRKTFPHSPEFNFTRGVAVSWDENADCPNIQQFVHEVTASKEDAETLIEWLGFCLTPGYDPHRFLLLHGPGGNGKGIYFEIVRSFFGSDNTSSVSLRSMTSGSRFHMSSLEGKMVNLDGDVSGGSINSEQLEYIKKLTGGDPVQVEEKHEPAFDLGNEAKLAFAANERPRFYENSSAIARRLLDIEMPYRYTDDPNDGHRDRRPREELLDELTNETELSGLLNYALNAIDHVESRGQFSSEMGTTAEERFKDYMAEADPILKFAQRCIEEDVTGVLPKDAVHGVFTKFAKAGGDPNPAEANVFWRNFKRTCEYEQRRPKIGDERPYVIDGIRFTDDAVDYIGEVHLKSIREIYRESAAYDYADLPEQFKDGPMSVGSGFEDITPGWNSFEATVLERQTPPEWLSGKGTLEDSEGNFLRYEIPADDDFVLTEGYTYEFENVWVKTNRDDHPIAELSSGVTDHRVLSEPEDDSMEWEERVALDGGILAHDMVDEQRAIRQTLEELFEKDPVRKSVVAKRVTSQVGIEPDRVEHLLEKLVQSGDIIRQGDSLEPNL
ncbi:phage/plasmid primase, P4 family [Natrinema sp. CGMCC1.2065]|uniref:phage/plasmid primase, P4 family n=1 Tax=Natrinema sp. CGMCC1.2065 TaxID=3445767 RepID=UPI003F4A6E8F